MKSAHDIVIIGAGPAGSTTARLLASRGFDVAVLEEHAVIGEPVDCTGVLGTDAFIKFELPRHLILGTIQTITVNSPAGVQVTHTSEQPLAHVIDRAELDRTLARQAETAGATVYLNAQAVDVVRDSSAVVITCRRPDGELRRLYCKLLILAGGPRFIFQERLGLGTCPLLWRSAHAELPGNSLANPQVFLGRDVAPGAFGWAVPLRRAGRPFVRLGVNSHSNASEYLQKLCADRFPYLLPTDGRLLARTWMLPIVALPRTAADRVLAVGDAAGQVKPTSGGGILFGMLSAQAAAETAAKALSTGSVRRESLSEYETRWRGRIGLDLRIGTLFRRLFSRMADADVDELLRSLSTEQMRRSLRGVISFDWHREIILFLLRHPSLARLFLRRWWDADAEPPFSDLSM